MIPLLNTGHMSFSDGPFTMPETVRGFVKETPLFAMSHRLMSEALRGFFDERLRGGSPFRPAPRAEWSVNVLGGS